MSEYLALDASKLTSDLFLLGGLDHLWPRCKVMITDIVLQEGLSLYALAKALKAPSETCHSCQCSPVILRVHPSASNRLRIAPAPRFRTWA